MKLVRLVLFIAFIALLLGATAASAGIPESKKIDPDVVKSIIHNSWKVEITNITLTCNIRKNEAIVTFAVNPGEQRVYFNNESVRISVLNAQGDEVFTDLGECSKPKAAVSIDSSDCFMLQAQGTVTAVVKIPSSAFAPGNSVCLTYIKWATEDVFQTQRVFSSGSTKFAFQKPN